jgi:hypothetical protein
MSSSSITNLYLIRKIDRKLHKVAIKEADAKKGFWIVDSLKQGDFLQFAIENGQGTVTSEYVAMVKKITPTNLTLSNCNATLEEVFKQIPSYKE